VDVKTRGRFRGVGPRRVSLGDRTGARGSAKADRYERVRAPASLIERSGPVGSKRSEIACLTPEALFEGDKVSFSAAEYLQDIEAALRDERVPNLGVVIHGASIHVDGIEFKIRPDLTIEGVAENLTPGRFHQALEKLLTLRNTHRILAHLDGNPQIMGTPTVIKLPDGSLTIKVMAEVRVNPELGSQANYVLDQHAGNLVMPQAAQPALRERNRRSVVLA
jgi:hypothetical protein